MTDATEDLEPSPPRKSRTAMLLAFCTFLAGAGVGFWGTYTGKLLPLVSGEQAKVQEKGHAALPDIAFVEMEPMTISLRRPAQGRHLRFRAQIEVPIAYASDVERLLPRVVDVLNGYLRAVEPADLEDSASLTRLRSQMLRRIQMVCGDERVNDILIMEFIIS